MVLLYLHSYQSLLWNKIVSRRINKYGLKPIVGDLVFKDNESKIEPVYEIIDEDENDEKEEDDIKFPEVETISEANLSKYTVFDVVYPLPGCDVSYPENEIGQWYTDLLANDNLTSDKLSKKNKYNYFLLNNILPCKIFFFKYNHLFQIIFSERNL